jgi:6-pyruvoyltetrahydropterin/6-carboxytetrahydropterin synthase
MGETFRVRVEEIRFDAAHFATFGGGCEPLHGHSYHVNAEAEGELTSDAWVVDFTRLKGLVRELCRQLDHRFLLQTQSRRLEIEEQESTWKIQTPARASYVFPKEDVAALPIDNTTAERLSEWFAAHVWRALTEKGGTNLRSVRVEVYEGPGQCASYQMQRLPLD